MVLLANCRGILSSVSSISCLLREIWHKQTHKASIVLMNALDFCTVWIIKIHWSAWPTVIATKGNDQNLCHQANQWHVTATSAIPYIHPNCKMIVWVSLDPYPNPQSKTTNVCWQWHKYNINCCAAPNGMPLFLSEYSSYSSRWPTAYNYHWDCPSTQMHHLGVKSQNFIALLTKRRTPYCSQA